MKVYIDDKNVWEELKLSFYPRKDDTRDFLNNNYNSESERIEIPESEYKYWKEQEEDFRQAYNICCDWHLSIKEMRKELEEVGIPTNSDSIYSFEGKYVLEDAMAYDKMQEDIYQGKVFVKKEEETAPDDEDMFWW